VQSIDIPLLLSRWLHLFAAIVAVGGAAYARWALLPAARESLDDAARERFHEGVRRRWRLVLFSCITVLLLTGALNFVMLAMPPKVKPMPYHGIFGIKFFLAMFIFYIASALVGRNPRLEAMRQKRATWLNALLGLAALVVLLSGVLSQVRTAKNALTAPATSVSRP
jgi:uncharacterized membrane protein